MMSTAEEPVRALRVLADLGVRIAIDDFGTGYCNLAYLRDLPVTELKVAGEFVAGLRDAADDPTSRTDERILASLVSLAHALDLTVTAEGVETPGRPTDCARSAATPPRGGTSASPVRRPPPGAPDRRHRPRRPPLIDSICRTSRLPATGDRDMPHPKLTKKQRNVQPTTSATAVRRDGGQNARRRSGGARRGGWPSGRPGSPSATPARPRPGPPRPSGAASVRVGEQVGDPVGEPPATSRPATTKPVSPSRTASGAPPESPATTGRPVAEASR